MRGGIHEHSSLLENIERFGPQENVDDQCFVVFVDQSHHAGREKRETGDRCSAVLEKSSWSLSFSIRERESGSYANGIDVRLDVSVFGDVEHVNMPKTLAGIVEGQLSNARQDLLIFRRPFGLLRLTIPMNRLEIIRPTNASRSLDSHRRTYAVPM